MKKFITYIAQQKKDLADCAYIPEDGEIRIRGDKRRKERNSEDYFSTAYPLLCLVDDYVVKDESIEVICMIEGSKEAVARNFERFKGQLENLACEIGFKYVIKEMEIAEEEVAASHIRTFRSLIGFIEDGDELYVCCTYGTKPIPIIEMMSLDYAYRVRKDVTIKSIVYGARNWETGESRIYDISELFHINQMVNHYASMGDSRSEKLIDNLLGLFGE